MYKQKEVNIEEVQNLLSETKKSIDRFETEKKDKGEDFNIFMIMKMEGAENKTHSNFITELLNPKGSHNKGNTFLKLFLNLLPEDSYKQLDIETVHAKAEHYVGPVDVESDTATGGQIDIYLWDKDNNSLSIENKIYAGEQSRQIERYCNHNKENNKVLYLTRYGSDTKSCGEFEEGTDFWKISYRNEIITWLEFCIDSCKKENNSNEIMLRESLKQYLNVVKKITRTLNTKQEQELKSLIINNLEAARHIRQNTNAILSKIREDFRKEVITRLTRELDSEIFEVRSGSDIDSKYAQVWIDFNDKSPLPFGIETFSGSTKANIDNRLFIGVTKYYQKKNIGDEFNLVGMNSFWSHYQVLKDAHGKEIRMRDESFLKQIQEKDSPTFIENCETVVKQVVGFIKSNMKLVKQSKSN